MYRSEIHNLNNLLFNNSYNECTSTKYQANGHCKHVDTLYYFFIVTFFRINDEEIPTVKQRMQKFQAGETTEQVNLPNGKPSRQKPKSRAFELFEQQNLVISPVS